MKLSLLSGRANPALAESVAAHLGVELGRCTVEDFPDHELRIAVHDEIQGHDVFLIQPTNPPVAKHLLELLLLADACRCSGAARLTAIIPYFGYARQDRRETTGEPVGARLIADLLCTRIAGIVTLDLHNPAIEGFFTIPAEHLSAVPLMAEKLRSEIGEDSILVAPDLGAVKLAQRYAELLDLPVAYIHKVRLSGHEVMVKRVIGNVKNRCPILIDDMISTGGTMVSASEALLDLDCRTPLTVVATHGLLMSKASQKLAALPVAKIILTDSVHGGNDRVLPIEHVSVGPLLADMIKHLYQNS
jgi:ribose-phosphate pyrophosphokinase